MGILDQIVGNAGNTGQPRRGLLGAVGGAQGLLQNPATMDLGLALLANSGYQSRRRGFGEILGTSMLQSRQMAAEAAQQKLREQYMQAQIQSMQEKRQPAAEENQIVVGPDGEPVYVPRSQAPGQKPYIEQRGSSSRGALLEAYDLAKSQGYDGTILDYQRDVASMTRAPTASAAPPEAPSNVREYEFFNRLPPEEQAQFLAMKRAQTVKKCRRRSHSCNPWRHASAFNARSRKHRSSQPRCGHRAGSRGRRLCRQRQGTEFVGIRCQPVPRPDQEDAARRGAGPDWVCGHCHREPGSNALR